MRNALPQRKQSTTGKNLFPLPASPQNLPVFMTLPSSQSEAILLRNSIGRIAFALDGRVQVLPVNYVYMNGWIYGRTAAPAYLSSNAAVTFQVDQYDAASEWCSVDVRGKLDLVESESEESTRGIYPKVLSSILRLVRAEVRREPSPLFHDQLFGIKAIEISGRGSLPVEGRFIAS